ncbi:MAG: DUF2244 domain-containing protein [Gammaproteobacteria bacterium]|nr:DUF2244 domain-containing protein [Gammaproteobacteria bacterium]MBU1972393.1 DUF2244 domain-containing protein [Gammaproteobacteria bacterium]
MGWVIEGSRSASWRPPPASRQVARSPLFPVFVVLAAISLTIAIVFACFGAWPVLPFAGLELAALGWAMRRCGGAPAAVPLPPTFCAASGACQRRPLPTYLIRTINLRRKPS